MTELNPDGTPKCHVKLVSASATAYTNGREGRLGWFVDRILTFVKEADNEEDAIFNLKEIMRGYEKRKTFWQKLKALLK